MNIKELLHKNTSFSNHNEIQLCYKGEPLSQHTPPYNIVVFDSQSDVKKLASVRQELKQI